MRPNLAAAFPLVALSACVTVAPLRPASPDQVVPGEPLEAFAEVSGVRLQVRAGDWRGWPENLESRLTPVEVAVENDSGRALRIEPRLFGLYLPSGFRHAGMEPHQVRAALRDVYRARAAVAFYAGWYGYYPWPGYYPPWRRRHYPYVWWGPYPWGVVVPYEAVPPPAEPEPRPSPEGTLASGGRFSLLVFFDVPATSLASATFEAVLEDTSGESLGRVRIPLTRAAPTPAAP
jgi:hypothetical protein